MPDNTERTEKLEKYLENNVIIKDRGQFFLFGLVLQQYADNELGGAAKTSLVLHIQNMLGSGHQPELVKGVMEIFGVNTKLVDEINDLDSEVGFDEGESPYD